MRAAGAGWRGAGPDSALAATDLGGGIGRGGSARGIAGSAGRPAARPAAPSALPNFRRRAENRRGREWLFWGPCPAQEPVDSPAGWRTDYRQGSDYGGG